MLPNGQIFRHVRQRPESAACMLAPRSRDKNPHTCPFHRPCHPRLLRPRTRARPPGRAKSAPWWRALGSSRPAPHRHRPAVRTGSAGLTAAGAGAAVAVAHGQQPPSGADVALARLDHPVDGVPTVPIATTAPRVGDQLHIAGWGRKRPPPEWMHSPAGSSRSLNGPRPAHRAPQVRAPRPVPNHRPRSEPPPGQQGLGGGRLRSRKAAARPSCTRRRDRSTSIRG